MDFKTDRIMTVGYVVADLDEVIAGKVSKFVESMRKLRERTRAVAETYFKPELTFGGLTPDEKQYAEVPARPEAFTGMAGTTLTGTFRQNLTATGWQKILSADLSDTGELKKKHVMGVVGIAIADSVARISQIQLVAGDYTHPVIDIELPAFKGKIAIVFDLSESDIEKFIFTPDRKFELYAYVVSTGYQTVFPLAADYVPKVTAIKQTIS